MLMNKSAPLAKKEETFYEQYGDLRADPFRWIRNREDPDVIAYLEAENHYTEVCLESTCSWQERLYEEMVGRMVEDDVSAPVRRGEYLYYTRMERGKQYSTFCRRKDGGAEEILLDGNALAEGLEYFQVGVAAVSPDQTLLAYSVDTDGSEILTIHVKDLVTGELLPDTIRNTYYGLAWAEDNRTIFYNVLNAARRPYKVFRHVLGTSAAADVEVYHEEDDRFEIDVDKTRSHAYVVLQIDSQTTSEVRYLDASNPLGEFRVLLPRRQDIEYVAVHHPGSWFVRINDTARTFRLIRMQEFGDVELEEVIAPRADVTLEELDAYVDHLVLIEREMGLRRIRIRKLSTGEEHYIDEPEPVYSIAAGESEEFRTSLLRYTYSSLATPQEWYDYDMNTRRRTLVKRQEVPGYDASAYQSARLIAVAEDGTRVPVSLITRKDRPSGPGPCLLYGYGAYGHSSEPTFSTERISLLDRGFAYAIAHIRGGGDLGKTWHDAGRMKNKINSFTDFIAAGEMLIGRGITEPEKLAIVGGSAGGLLMGAVLNMRPDLFGAVVAKVPFVDLISTMLDPTLPLTVGEYEEWGNPAEEESYRAMRAYSPYDNVAPRRYPHLLVTAGLNDPRVSYWEPAKWVARLRTVNQGSNLLLLRTNLGAGHFGASGRYERLKERAYDYAFICLALGVPVIQRKDMGRMRPRSVGDDKAGAVA